MTQDIELRFVERKGVCPVKGGNPVNYFVRVLQFRKLVYVHDEARPHVQGLRAIKEEWTPWQDVPLEEESNE